MAPRIPPGTAGELPGGSRVRSTISAMSSKGTANMSWRTSEPLGRRQRVEHHQQGQSDRVRLDNVVLQPRARRRGSRPRRHPARRGTRPPATSVSERVRTARLTLVVGPHPGCRSVGVVIDREGRFLIGILGLGRRWASARRARMMRARCIDQAPAGRRRPSVTSPRRAVSHRTAASSGRAASPIARGLAARLD